VRTRSWSRESRTSWPRTSAAGDDCREDGVCAVYDGVLVVAGGQATPLLEQVEGPLDDVSPLVGLSVELWRTPTAGATTLPARLLVGRFGDHDPDPTPAQHRPVAARGVCPVSEHGVWRRLRLAHSEPGHTYVGRHDLQRSSVVRLAWRDDDGERPAPTVDSVTDLARQPTTRPADSVTRRFTVDGRGAVVLAIRPRPLCPAPGGSCSSRAGGHG
jgi:hypothetical protein